MFGTYDYAEIPIPEELCEPGEKGWAFISFILHVPWFHVTYTTPGEGGKWRHMAFFLNPEQIVALSKRPFIKLEEVQIVLPKHMTGAACWTMQLLSEIRVGEEREVKGQLGYVYVLANGNRYVHAGAADDEKDLLKSRVYLSCPKPRRPKSARNA